MTEIVTDGARRRRPFVYLDFCFYAFCNFTCTYCRETNEQMSKGAGREGFDRALEDFLAQNEAAVLKMSGYGEATLWSELAEAVAPWATEFPTVQLISNGAGPPAVYDRLCALPNFQACVTLDGHRPELDRFRTKGSARLHGRVVRTVDRLVDAGVRVELNCVLSRANADHLDEYLAWVADRWGDAAVLVPFPVRPTLGRDPAQVRDELAASPAQVDAIESALVDRHVEHAPVLAPLPYVTAVVAFMRESRRSAPCHVHRANFGVNTDLLALACACAGDRLITPLGPVSAAWTQPDVLRRQQRFLAAGNVGAKCVTCFTHYDVINLYLEGSLSSDEVARLPSLSTTGALRMLERVRAELRPYLHRERGTSHA